jgi:hypothetical protein
LETFKVSVIVVLLMAFAWFGWQVNEWRTEAARAKALAEQVESEQVKASRADAARVEVEKALKEKGVAVVERVRVVKKMVPHVVQVNCDLPDEFAGELQRFRKGIVSNTSK